jgi:hypothetical protein
VSDAKCARAHRAGAHLFRFTKARAAASSLNHGGTVQTQVVMMFAAGDSNTIAGVAVGDGMRLAVGGGSAYTRT